jgi:hypothetical protein
VGLKKMGHETGKEIGSEKLLFFSRDTVSCAYVFDVDPV